VILYRLAANTLIIVRDFGLNSYNLGLEIMQLYCLVDYIGCLPYLDLKLSYLFGNKNFKSLFAIM
jgi:hypothetical protein